MPQSRSRNNLMQDALGLSEGPMILPRTRETQEAQEYGLAGLLRDVAWKIYVDSSEGLEGASEKLLESSDEELQEIGLAGLGGMVKTVGMAKLLPKVLRQQKAARTSLNKYVEEYNIPRQEKADRMKKAWLKTLGIPEKEWKPLRDIRWGQSSAEECGSFLPAARKIFLSPSAVRPTTPPHEFSHLRQQFPQGEKEALDMAFLRSASAELRNIYSPTDFYYRKDPMEQIARDVPAYMTQGFSFEKAYKSSVAEALERIEQGADFSSAEIKNLWELALWKPSARKKAAWEMKPSFEKAISGPSRKTSVIKGFGGKSGSMWSTEQAVEFGRKAPRSMEGLLKEGVERQQRIADALRRKYGKTQSLKDLALWQEQGYKRQLYREALQGMEGQSGFVKTPPADLRSRKLGNLVSDLQQGKDVASSVRVGMSQYEKNPEKYSKFLVANYKLAPFQDKEVLRKAAQRILKEEVAGSAGIDWKFRARKILMGLGEPQVIRGGGK